MSENIILLTVDALRADHVSWVGYERETTPYLDGFSQNATVFESAYAASSHTRESVPALLTGRHPTEAVSEGYTRGAKTLPMLLPDEYATAGFHSNPYVSRAYGYDEGFDTFDDDLRLGQNKVFALVQRALDKFVLRRGEYHARAENINGQALSWLDSVSDDRPFFLWNHYMDVHGPYSPPEGFAKWSDSVTNTEAQRLYNRLSGEHTQSEADVELAKALYDGEIAYADAKIWEFINSLETRGLLDDTLILLTSDHGDLFGEHGNYVHPRYVYPELTHVPLLLYSPNLASSSVGAPVSTLDIVPTALEVSGVENSELPGESLLNTNQLDENRLVYSSATGEKANINARRFAVQTKKRGARLTRDQKTGEISSEEYYELPSGTVIHEGATWPDDSPYADVRLALVEHSDEHLNGVSKEEGDNRVATSGDVEKRLNALGYK